MWRLPRDAPFDLWSFYTKPSSPASFTRSLFFQDSHSVASESHNTFVENLVSTERAPMNMISTARLILKLQLCISVAYNNPSTQGGRGVSCQIVTVFSTWGSCTFGLFVNFDKKYDDLPLSGRSSSDRTLCIPKPKIHLFCSHDGFRLSTIYRHAGGGGPP